MSALFLAVITSMMAQWAVAQTPAPSEADQLRAELRALKQDYDQRIQAMEEHLRRIEAPAVVVVTNRAPAEPMPAAMATASTNAAVRARQFAKQEFQRDTESRDHALLTETNPLNGRLEKVLQDFVDINGYFRAGYGRDSQGGPQVGFQAPGALAKYRLGNEAENYGELTFGKNFYVPGLFRLDAPPPAGDAAVGPVARVQTTLSIYNPYQDLLSSSGTQFGMPELCVHWQCHRVATLDEILGGQPLLPAA